jgi:ERCC4-type nuclease
MKTQASTLTDDYDDPLITIEGEEEAHDVAFSSRFQLKQ